MMGYWRGLLLLSGQGKGQKLMWVMVCRVSLLGRREGGIQVSTAKQELELCVPPAAHPGHWCGNSLHKYTLNFTNFAHNSSSSAWSSYSSSVTDKPSANWGCFCLERSRAEPRIPWNWLQFHLSHPCDMRRNHSQCSGNDPPPSAAGFLSQHDKSHSKSSFGVFFVHFFLQPPVYIEEHRELKVKKKWFDKGRMFHL